MTATTAAREERAAAEVAAAARECGGAMVDGARVRGRRKAGAFPHFGAGAAVVGQREAGERASGGAGGKGPLIQTDPKERERKKEGMKPPLPSMTGGAAVVVVASGCAAWWWPLAPASLAWEVSICLQLQGGSYRGKRGRSASAELNTNSKGLLVDQHDDDYDYYDGAQ